MGHYGYRKEHVDRLRILYALHQASPPNGYMHYAYGGYGVDKTIDLTL